MAENNEQRASESRSDDPDWIKGLVAQALIKAAEAEDPPAKMPPATTPPAAGSTPPAAGSTPPAAGSTPPSGRPVTRVEIPDLPEPPDLPGQSTLPDPPVLFDADLHQRPLVVGREQQIDEEVPLARPTLPPMPARRNPAPRPSTPTDSDSPTRHAPPLSQSPSVTERDFRAPAVALAERPLTSTSTLEPDTYVTGDGPSDEVMEPEEVTTEGFRSSDIRTVLEWLAVIVSALVVALVIKGFVLQAFYIPSESMETTVNEGDRILVNKVSYRLHDVRRGDLVVFKKLPGTASQTDDLIKRAIALPGETIEVRDDGRIWIWGSGETAEDAKRLEEPYLDPQNELLQAPDSSMAASQDIWHERCVNQPRNPGRCTLAEDQFFMMGDNRNQSSDSRFFGPVTEDLIVGRAFLRIWPLGEFSSL